MYQNKNEDNSNLEKKRVYEREIYMKKEKKPQLEIFHNDSNKDDDSNFEAQQNNHNYINYKIQILIHSTYKIY